LAALTVFPSSHANAQSSAIARIQAAGKLTVAVFFEDVVPFFYVGADGKLVGVDPSIAEDIAEKLGVTLEYNRAATTFDGLIDEVVEGRADMAISLLSDTLERATRASFSESYVSVRQFLLINRLQLGRLVAADPERANDIPALLNNPQSRIGVIDGTSYVGFVAEDFPEAQNVAFATWPEMLAAVKSGDLVALMYDEIEIGNWRLADAAGAVELRPYHLAGHPDTIAIAMPPGDSDLKAWVDLYLAKAKSNGFIDGVLNRYLYSKDRALIDG
jgi:ABC-type amino acid transport substrate-binding protein